MLPSKRNTTEATSDLPIQTEDDSMGFFTVSEGTSSSPGAGGFSDQEEEHWIEWFCRKRGHEFLCHVDAAFIMDDFNY